MREFDPTISDYSKALSRGESPGAIARARIRREREADRSDAAGRAQIAAWKAQARAQGLWMVQSEPQRFTVQTEPKRCQTKKQKPVLPPQLARLQAHFRGDAAA